MTTFSVWAIACAQRVASSSASDGALREAKKAAKGLSNKSLFPDKSIKKAQALHLLIPNSRPWLPFTRISNTNAHAGDISHIPSQSVVGYTTLRGHFVVVLLESLNRQV